MILEKITLLRYNWEVIILLQTTCKNTNEILSYLDGIDCPIDLRNEAIGNISSCNKNTGLTYSNFKIGKSVMVISKTSKEDELINTITHECYHLICHIKKARGIESEEELATLTGNFNMNLWLDIKNILHLKHI